MGIQRRVKISETKDIRTLSRQVETALEELKGLLERHTVQNFLPSDPNNNLQYYDEDNNRLYLYNTTTKTWNYLNLTEV